MEINKSAVVLITFKKHLALEEILNAISNYFPPKLYIFQDAAKSESELLLTNKVHDIIHRFKFNFPVEIVQHKRPLKLNTAVTTALNYCFEKEEKMIILEDDIVPTESFFNFCNHLLIEFNDSTKAGCINGCNLNAVNIENSYFLSNLSFPYWGWATWRDKWMKFRLDNYYLEHYQYKMLNSICNENRIYFRNLFKVNPNSLNVWDVNWNISLIANDFKTIIPGVNLVTNKGFTEHALSTNYSISQFKEMKTASIDVNVLKQKKSITKKYKNKYEIKINEFVQEVKMNLENNQIKKFEV